MSDFFILIILILLMLFYYSFIYETYSLDGFNNRKYWPYVIRYDPSIYNSDSITRYI